MVRGTKRTFCGRELEKNPIEAALGAYEVEGVFVVLPGFDLLLINFNVFINKTFAQFKHKPVD